MFGLSTPWLMHEGIVVPSVIALSHTEQLDRLRLACPEAVPAARVVGDPCADRLAASRPLRETYRQAFGLTAGQRLVVVSSTWGEHSLYGRWPELVHTLAQQLPLETHRVALALHPNIPHGHSPWQVRMWLDACRRDGVLVLPDGDLWLPALVAADVVVGDHGSVSYYSAAHGVPVLLASAPADVVDPDSPVGEFLRLAAKLGRDDDLPGRIEQAIQQHDPDAYARIGSLATSCPGEFAALFQQVVFDVAGLSTLGSHPRTPAAPVPRLGFSEPRATLVRATLDPAPHRLDVAVERYPAGSLTKPSTMPADTHLVVDAQDPDLALLPLADVVINRNATDAAQWITATLSALPGCQLAAARDGDGWLLGAADGETVRLHTAANPKAGHVFASAVHAWLCSGRRLTELPSRLGLRLAAQTVTAAVVATAPDDPRSRRIAR